MTKSNAQIFREAAQYIREHGWRQGALGTEGGPVCAQGAIRMASSLGMEGEWTPEALTASYLASERVRVAAQDRRLTVDAIVWWNDTVCQSADELIQLFDGLAFDEELKEQATHVPAVKEAATV